MKWLRFLTLPRLPRPCPDPAPGTVPQTLPPCPHPFRGAGFRAGAWRCSFHSQPCPHSFRGRLSRLRVNLGRLA